MLPVWKVLSYYVWGPSINTRENIPFLYRVYILGERDKKADQLENIKLSILYTTLGSVIGEREVKRIRSSCE